MFCIFTKLTVRNAPNCKMCHYHNVHHKILYLVYFDIRDSRGRDSERVRFLRWREVIIGGRGTHDVAQLAQQADQAGVARHQAVRLDQL